jgi:NADH:ubiquinone oxidoreductase subunit K
MTVLDHMLYLGALLFSVGLVIVVIKKSAIMILLGLELMLNASNINLVAFNKIHGSQIDGQMFSLFVIVVAVCEAAVGLAIVLRVYQFYKTSVPDEVSALKD